MSLNPVFLVFFEGKIAVLDDFPPDPGCFSPSSAAFVAKGGTYPQQAAFRTAFFRLKAMALRRNSSSTLARPRYLAR